MKNRIANPHTRRSRITNAAEPKGRGSIEVRKNRIANPHTRYSRITNAAEPSPKFTLVYSSGEFAIRPQ